MTTEISLVTVALDRPLDLRRRRPNGARVVLGIPGHVTLPTTPVVHLFAFGAAVVEGDIDTVMGHIEEVTGAKPMLGTQETWRLRVGDGAPHVGWDEVTLPHVDEHGLAVVALLLGQSAALDRYDTQVNALVQEVLALLADLASRGRFPWAMPMMVRRIAGIATTQLELTQSFFLVDRPETTWEDPVSGGVFEVLYDHLELEERHAAIEKKLDTLSSTLRTVADLQNGRRGLFLETAIVLLIVLEVVLVLLGA